MLSSIGIPELADSRAHETGMDSVSVLGDRFYDYPMPVSYSYNKRGFRDRDWPEDIKNVIWCIGDSFTTGLGAPVEHTWWYQLELITGRRCINISMDGASNQWIARQACAIQKELGSVPMVIMWSYLHRRESLDSTLSDLERRIWHNDYFEDHSDVENWLECYHQTNNDQTIHSVIPDVYSWFWLLDETQKFWYSINEIKLPELPRTEKDFNLLSNEILGFLLKNHKKELKKLYDNLSLLELHNRHKDIIDNLILVKQIDYSRDQHHFDIATARDTALRIAARLNLPQQTATLNEIVLLADLW